MDIKGNWVACSKYAGNDPGLKIGRKHFTYFESGRRGDAYEKKKTGYKLKEIRHLVRDAECCEIVLDPLPGYGMPEFYCHTETVDGQEIPVISLTTMEYDGRGLIVMVTYVREQDRQLVTEDFESLMYKTLNKRSAPPMHKISGGPMAGMGSIMQGMTMGDVQALMNGVPTFQTVKPSDPSADAEVWDCSCGKKGNTGKFCPECGNNKPKRSE